MIFNIFKKKHSVPFHPFHKICRASRLTFEITEKIDGTNGVIYISDDLKQILAGCRTRWLINKKDENFGFKSWVEENKEDLLSLGPGYHYGEWAGKGINRNYKLEDKKFFLFNNHRWRNSDDKPECCEVVPLLYLGEGYDKLLEALPLCEETLRKHGSIAVPEFMEPEGLVVYSKELNNSFKVIFPEFEDKPKKKMIKQGLQDAVEKPLVDKGSFREYIYKP